MLNYEKGFGESKNWIIEETKFDERYLGKCESIFCQGNGYLGVRNTLEEEYVTEKRDMFVTGTFNKADDGEVTELPNFPDLTKIVLKINKERFSLLQGKILDYSRTMDLRDGETVRAFTWESDGGKRYSFRFRRFISLHDEHVMAMRVEIISLDENMSIEVVSGIDGTVSNTGSQHFYEGERRVYDHAYLEMVSTTVQSKVVAGIYTTHRFFENDNAVDVKILPLMSRRKVGIEAKAEIKKGNTFVIEKLSTIHTTRDKEWEGVEQEEAVKRLKEAGYAKVRVLGEEGYETLYKASASCWKSFWKREDVTIDSSNFFDQLGIRFAIYHLNIMVKRDDNRVGIGAKAMTGEGYKGHSFWDTEVFLLPYYLLTSPNTARMLLEYRHYNLKGAREKARLAGYEGAMYPWEAAWIDDGEVTPVWGPADVTTGKPIQYLTGLIEQHISADVAFAVWQYFNATGDQEFMNRCGYEMIFDTAKFWTSRLEWNEKLDRYEINDVIGPDEYKEHVNNNAYTNYLAHYNMKLAFDLLPQVQLENPELYKKLDESLGLEALKEKVAEGMQKIYLPQPTGEEQIIEQMEGYFNLNYVDLTKYKESSEVLTIYKDYSPEQINQLQVSKQGDLVVLFYLLEDLFDEEIKRNNYNYYEERTLHDSSLSKCTHGVVAMDLGMSEEAYHFYEGACQVDLGIEMKSSDEGIHSAAMGGIWQVAVLGFGGVRIVGGQLRIHPVLPKKWNSLKFRIVWKGSPIVVNICKDGIELMNEGKEVTVYFEGKEIVLEEGMTYKK